MTGARQTARGTVLEFFGGTETVTGSRFLLSSPRGRVLVDCGLYQGLRPLRRRNWEPLPFDPERVDAVVLTHAHVDHSGFLPRLVRQGFRGPIFATRRTVELCRIVLPDAAHLAEEEADYANRAGYSKHSPALPLFDSEDAAAALGRLRAVEPGETLEVATGVRAEFRPAGHILGSASIQLALEGREAEGVLFSGDLGRPVHPLLAPPAPPPAARQIVVESTYGDRAHCEENAEQALGAAISRAVERGGVVVIPAFAVDRTEVVLFHLARLMRAGALAPLPIYVDSPMALASLEVYRRAIDDGDPELRPELREDPELLRPEKLVEARSVDASKAIHEVNGPALIISASGMATGGRVLHHLARRLPDRRNSVVFVGFQAAGSRGRRLIEGASEVKLLGRHVPVRAEVVDLSAFSVHADQSELIDWLGSAPEEPECVYVVHGEPSASNALRERIHSQLGWCAVVPRYRERVLVLPPEAERR